MRNRLQTSLLVLALSASLAGCDSFLTGPKISDDPNNPTSASNTALFVAAQANMYVQMENHLARSICLWMQACSGQGPQYGLLGVYGIGADEYYGFWSGTYGGGGLLDLRRVRRSTELAGDSVFAGMAMVLEVSLVGSAADVWGDIPYREAVDPSNNAPSPDPQQQIYGDIQALLDTAIVFLGATAPSNKGPAVADLSYDGDATKWIALAHTLKARFHLHTAEVLGNPAYAAALAEAQQGIGSAADDFTAYHSLASTERNLWSQFTSTWLDFIKAGRFMVDRLVADGDPRLAVYYGEVPGSPGVYRGADPVDTLGVASLSDLGATVLAPDYRQPLVTWAETQLIVAEAAYHTSNAGLALTSLENVRAAAGLAPIAPAPAGQALLDAIMTEKYITMFQTIETWSDYRRSCIPALTPAAGGEIPARMGYPASESVANPNLPNAGPLRNWNDPNPCP